MAEPLVIEINKGQESVVGDMLHRSPQIIIPALIWVALIAAIVYRNR